MRRWKGNWADGEQAVMEFDAASGTDSLDLPPCPLAEPPPALSSVEPLPRRAEHSSRSARTTIGWALHSPRRCLTHWTRVRRGPPES